MELYDFLYVYMFSRALGSRKSTFKLMIADDRAVELIINIAKLAKD